MAKCPHCGSGINDWHILTLGKESTIVCRKCRRTLRVPDKVSGVKVFAGVGFLLGGLAGGLCVALPSLLKWFVFVLLWFLLLALADIRYTRLESSPNEPAPKK